MNNPLELLHLYDVPLDEYVDDDDEPENPLDDYWLPGVVHHHSDDFRHIGYLELANGRKVAYPDFGKKVGIPYKHILRLMYHEAFYDGDGDVNIHAIREVFGRKYTAQNLADALEIYLETGAIRLADDTSDAKWVRGKYDLSPVTNQCQFLAEYQDAPSQEAFEDAFNRRIVQPLDITYFHWDGFRSWHKTEKGFTMFRPIYVDMADGHFNAGLILAHLIYWHLPTKNYNPQLNRGKSDKLTVEKQGRRWFVCKRDEWQKRLRLTPDKADGALRQLEKLGLIERKRMKYKNAPTTHIWLNKELLLEAWVRLLADLPDNPDD